jgi:hypothetical protein
MYAYVILCTLMSYYVRIWCDMYAYVRLCPTMYAYVPLCPTMGAYGVICRLMSPYVRLCPTMSHYVTLLAYCPSLRVSSRPVWHQCQMPYRAVGCQRKSLNLALKAGIGGRYVELVCVRERQGGGSAPASHAGGFATGAHRHAGYAHRASVAPEGRRHGPAMQRWESRRRRSRRPDSLTHRGQRQVRLLAARLANFSDLGGPMLTKIRRLVRTLGSSTLPLAEVAR